MQKSSVDALRSLGFGPDETGGFLRVNSGCGHDVDTNKGIQHKKVGAMSFADRLRPKNKLICFKNKLKVHKRYFVLQTECNFIAHEHFTVSCSPFTYHYVDADGNGSARPT